MDMENADEHRLLSISVEDAESAIDKLPLEIWAHIFKFGTHFEESWEEEEPAVLPWKVSRVCRFWRSAALSTPDLWANIVIESQHLFGRDIDALQLQLDRSQQYLLSLRFVGLGTIIPGSYPELSLKRLKETLRPHLRRVRLLQFPEGSWDLILPQIRRSLTATSIFPSLREVEYTGYPSNIDLNSIPFQQLTHISLISMEQTHIWKIIERSKVTVEVLRIIEPTPDWVTPNPPLRQDRGHVLPRLKSLALGNANAFLGAASHHNKYQWRIHSAPSLQELAVFDPEGDLGSITAFIQRSSSSSGCPPPLTSFTISHNRLSYGRETASESSLKSFFSAVPALTSLDIHLCNLDTLNSILKVLARTNASPSCSVPEFCPSLRSIRLGNDDEDEVFGLDKFDLASLVKMVESRGLGKVEIRNVIEKGDEISDMDKEAVSMLMESYEMRFI